jgi:hypothetical protein
MDMFDCICILDFSKKNRCTCEKKGLTAKIKNESLHNFRLSIIKNDAFVFGICISDF